MISRDIVRKAIHFDHPSRLPFTGSMAETDFSGDTVALFPEFLCKWWLGGGGRDEWGCQWEVVAGTKDCGQVKNIILPILAEYEQIVVPDASNPGRYATWEPILDRCEREGKYVVLCNGSFLFERAHFLHGFTRTLIDIAEEPQIMRRFLGHLARYHFDTIRYVREHFPGRIHGYRGTDDWGMQAAPFISPSAFGDVFQPVYEEIFSAVHDAGMDVWMHSCGHNLELIDGLIDAGLDVINLLQPAIFPIPKLREFRGRICFEMVGDIQSTLLKADRDAIRREIEAILDACCTESGGLVVVRMDRTFFDADGISPEIGTFCEEEYRRLDPWKDQQQASERR